MKTLMSEITVSRTEGHECTICPWKYTKYDDTNGAIRNNKTQRL